MIRRCLPIVMPNENDKGTLDSEIDVYVQIWEDDEEKQGNVDEESKTQIEDWQA